MSEPVWRPTERYIKRAKVYKWFDCFPNQKCRIERIRNGPESIYHIFAPRTPTDDEKEWMQSHHDDEVEVEEVGGKISLSTDVVALIKARRAEAK